MKFSQWLNSPIAERTGFGEYCRFKDCEERGEAEHLVEMARVPIKDRAETRRTAYLMDQVTLFLLAQIPQSLWSQAYAYLHDFGIHALQQEMKNAGIRPLVKTRWDDPSQEMTYLGGTGGTAEEQKSYDEVRNYLKKKLPYDFITLGWHTFLVVNHPLFQVSPLAYMYMKIDNSVNDQWLREQPIRSREDRQRYMQQVMLKGHGLHGNYLNNFDPPLIGKQNKQYHQWAGYTGINADTASKAIRDYLNHLHWYHIPENPDIDDPNIAKFRRESFQTAQKDPNLMHTRVTKGGSKGRRTQPFPIYSGDQLTKQMLPFINGRRNEVIATMPQGVRNDYHIIIENGTSNIEIGAKQGHAKEGKIHDACTFPYWDGEKNLHGASEPNNPYVQAMPMLAPAKLIPQDVYLKHRFGHQLLAWLAKELKTNVDGFHQLLKLWTTIPQTPQEEGHSVIGNGPFPDSITQYAEILKQASGEISTTKPPKWVFAELQQAGLDLSPKKKIREANEPQGKKERASLEPLINAMEIALFTRCFKYWLNYERQPPLGELPADQMSIHQLLDEFGARSQVTADHILKNAKLGDLVDYHLEQTHAGPDDPKVWTKAHGFSHSPTYNDPYTAYASTEEWTKFQQLCDRDYRQTMYQHGVDGVRDFINSDMSKKNVANREILMEKQKSIAEEALSEYKNTKTSKKTVWQFVQLWEQLEKLGFDPKDDQSVSQSPPNVSKPFFTARIRLLKDFHDKSFQFAQRIWQLDLGWGSRRKAEKTKSLFEKYGSVGAIFVKPTADIELDSRKWGATVLKDRGKEEQGMIFGPSVRRRYLLALKRVDELNQDKANFEAATGLKWDKIPEAERKSTFAQFATELRLQVFKEKTKSIVHIAENARKARRDDLEKSGAIKNMNEYSIEKELEEAAQTKVKEYLDQQMQDASQKVA